MFDLFRSRDKAVRLLLGAMLGLVGLSMLTYLIPNYGDGTVNTDTMVVAKVGNENITLPQVQRLIQATMRGRQLPPELIPTYVPTIVDNMITDHALAYQAAQLGFEVTDDQVRAAIQQMIPSLFPDGKFVGKEAYAAMLAQQNLSIPEFEADLRRQLLVTRVRNVALEGSIVTPVEIEQAYRRKNEKIKIEFVKLTADKYRKELEPSVADMQAYYKANIGRYTAPEGRNLTLLVADQAKMEQTVNPTEAELLRVYNQDQSPFRMPETVKVRHILLKTEGKPPEEDAKLKAQAEDLLKQIKGGANFADLVKRYSEDTGSVAANGEYDNVTRGQMVPEFDKAAFTQKPGETSIVKTTYGYHIVQTMTHNEPRVKPFAEVKGDLAAQYKKQRVSELMQNASDRAEAALRKDPTQPEKIAAQFGLQVVKADNVTAGKALPELGPNPEFDTAVSGLRKGEVSQPVAFTGDKVAFAVVTDVVPAHPQNFEEVQGAVKEAMIQARGVVAVQKHAKELFDKAQEMGDLGKAAKSMGLDVKTSDEFARGGAVDGLGSATYVQEGFSRPNGSLMGPLSTPDATVVAKVIAHSEADLGKLAEERGTIREEIKRQKSRDRNSLFESGLIEMLTKEGTIKKNQEAINRLIATYKTS
jgi:peptidyl-prolyl cis-trans isomerase D